MSLVKHGCFRLLGAGPLARALPCPTLSVPEHNLMLGSGEWVRGVQLGRKNPMHYLRGHMSCKEHVKKSGGLSGPGMEHE